MNNLKTIIFTLLLMGSIVTLSCDNRGKNITGPAASYNVNVFAYSDVTVPKDEVKIGCFITDQSGALVDDIKVYFDAFIDPNVPDSSRLSYPFRWSSDLELEDGLSGEDLILDPKGEVGDFKIVASINDDEGNYSNSDTTIIQVIPYLITLSADDTTLTVHGATNINCIVAHPVTYNIVSGINLLFSTDFGTITPSASSTDQNLSGLSSPVIFNASEDDPGTANIFVRANLYPEHNMGVDTLQISISN